ncbi:hypothetical protein RRG08_031468 [Elysia crispata]|uniref:Uncharacterized protein n=1 Tax=Elysia crispata TaxID=231223 RepID=A0AAE0ZN13_9GAST|nr:hypothetical protein RRG08_031468 [Elysia crispata]
MEMPPRIDRTTKTRPRDSTSKTGLETDWLVPPATLSLSHGSSLSHDVQTAVSELLCAGSMKRSGSPPCLIPLDH